MSVTRYRFYTYECSSVIRNKFQHYPKVPEFYKVDSKVLNYFTELLCDYNLCEVCDVLDISCSMETAPFQKYFFIF